MSSPHALGGDLAFLIRQAINVKILPLALVTKLLPATAGNAKSFFTSSVKLINTHLKERECAIIIFGVYAIMSEEKRKHYKYIVTKTLKLTNMLSMLIKFFKMNNIFEERANPFGNVENKEIITRLQLIADEFGNEWLNKNNVNPLQILWRRKDIISTLELYTLSKAIEKIICIDRNWFNYQKKIIKDDNKNNTKGALWEIIGAYYLMDPKNKIVPSPISQKGIDLTSTIITTRKKINYSLKNYSFSNHHNIFIKECNKINNFVKKKIKGYNIKSIQISIIDFNSYPSEYDWGEVKECLDIILTEFKDSYQTKYKSYKNWLFSCGKLPDTIENHEISNRCESYIIFISVPYHKNEKNNLLSNIEDAILNLKHANIKEDKNSINSLFIHIPTTASIIQCSEWIMDFFKQTKENPIGQIILYQPSINFDFTSKTTYLQHCVRITQNATIFDQWFENDLRNKIELWFETGIFISNPFKNKIVINGNVFDLKENYALQTGHLFVKPKALDENKLFARFGKYTNGINIHTTYKDKIITTPYSQDDELLIL